jgi:hypothetical protein
VAVGLWSPLRKDANFFGQLCGSECANNQQPDGARATALFHGVLFLHCRPIIF